MSHIEFTQFLKSLNGLTPEQIEELHRELESKRMPAPHPSAARTVHQPLSVSRSGRESKI